AVEIKFHRNASGISGDITQAVHCARRLICFNAYYGFRLLDVDPGDKLILSDSQRQAIVRLLEEKYDQAKELLIKYDKLVDYVSGELLSKGYVFRSELLMMKNKIEKSYKKNIR
ncbi:hypothetical protein, partial [Butyrivibrio sp.]|uniref:hypothetical protein n=1 Tax=Butyrivibrio sp. TaxID=28121 RepID=UPI0025C648FA